LSDAELEVRLVPKGEVVSLKGANDVVKLIPLLDPPLVGSGTPLVEFAWLDPPDGGDIDGVQLVGDPLTRLDIIEAVDSQGRLAEAPNEMSTKTIIINADPLSSFTLASSEPAR
jgi:hypothetical protein